MIQNELGKQGKKFGFCSKYNGKSLEIFGLQNYLLYSEYIIQLPVSKFYKYKGYNTVKSKSPSYPCPTATQFPRGNHFISLRRVLAKQNVT